MNITLISPHPDVRAFGLRTLAACLKRAQHDVQMVFLPTGFHSASFTQGYEDSTLKELVEISRDADLVGISLMTNFFDNAVQMTQKLQKDLNVPVLWGGVHPTIRPEECMGHADIVCTGEGEESLVELAGRMHEGKDYHNVQGMWFKNNGEITRNGLRPLIRNLDTVPFQDYDYDTHFILDGVKLRNMDENLLQRHMQGDYMTLPSRGCPFTCTYCVNNTLNKMYPTEKALRYRTADNTIAELLEAKNSLPGVERIVFDDDAYFILPTEVISEFCDKYKQQVQLPLTITGATPTTMHREKLALLVDAGLVALRMGVETGSENTKLLYKRNFRIEKIEKAVSIIDEFKDKFESMYYDIILDNPWETDEERTETLMFLSKFPTPYKLSLFSLTFYPETDLYTLAKKDGIITDDLEDVYRKYYLGCKKTYMNSLFFLLDAYARRGGRLRITPKLMSLLTNNKLRQLKLAWLLYICLKIGFIGLWALPSKNQGPLYLLREGWKDLRRGDLFRITRYLKAKLSPFGPTNVTIRTQKGHKRITLAQ